MLKTATTTYSSLCFLPHSNVPSWNPCVDYILLLSLIRCMPDEGRKYHAMSGVSFNELKTDKVSVS